MESGDAKGKISIISLEKPYTHFPFRLGSEGATLAGLGATTLLVRVASRVVKAKEGVELRLGDFGVLEATCKSSFVTQSKCPTDSWLPLWSGVVDGGESDPVEYHLLAPADA